MQPFISACLIVKNEEDMLRRCLDSLQGQVDEIVIADTGSTDATKDIAKEFTDKVYDFEWTDDFAEARNFVASYASGEWILAVDADECIDPESFQKAKEDMQQQAAQYDCYLVDILSFTGQNGDRLAKNKMARIYKNDGTFRYEEPIHEQLTKREGKASMAVSSLILYHYGYLQKAVEKKRKNDRNIKMIKKNLGKGKQKGFSYFNYGQELRRLGKKEEALDAFIQAYKYKLNVKHDWVQRCLIYITEILVDLKRYTEALNIVSDAEKIWPTAPDFLYQRGEIYYLQKRLDDAKEVFLEIVTNPDKYKDVIYLYESQGFYPHFRLGEIYEIEKNDEQALKHYSKAYNYNHAAVQAIVKILYIINKFHTVEETYEFAVRNNFLRTEEQALSVIRILLNSGFGALSVALAAEYVKEQIAHKAIQLKAGLMQEGKTTRTTLVFETEELVYGVRSGMFDMVDLCLLYHITKDERVQDLIKCTEFAHIFTFLFRETKNAKKITEQDYIDILGKALRFGQAEFAEMLISRKQEIGSPIDAKIAGVFYENGYEDIAMDFYGMADEKYVTEQGYVNIIEWLLKQGNIEEAKRFVLEGVRRFEKDFRFYKYEVELNEKRKKALVKQALERFPDSKWLQKN